jgi:Zn-finger nucleic acid-binding protein
MRCPRCGGELRTITYEGSNIETCPDCEGEWLDRGELIQIVRTVEKSFPPEMRDSLDALNENIFTVDESLQNQLSCPKCPDTELNRFNYASSSGVALDKCPKCGGIWLDKDELEKVQILVEEWHGKAKETAAEFAPLLEKYTAEAEMQNKKNGGMSRFGFINAILRRF